ncbi:MAG TPA: Bro-N domain-containing protein [Ferrovibrio sp.]|uniref:BRO-N domain-containing protein n=1 Tax=Ferrovibrio sp. TaxID=1917215 RepID=UPI002ED08C89
MCPPTNPAESVQVRVVQIEGNLWFVAADVCRALGIGVSPNGHLDVWHATRAVASDEQMLLPRSTQHLVVDSAARLFEPRQRHLKLISESGLYRLILRSDKPEARQFQDWVTRVVLPAIRKDGAYISGSWFPGVKSAPRAEELRKFPRYKIDGT